MRNFNLRKHLSEGFLPQNLWTIRDLSMDNTEAMLAGMHMERSHWLSQEMSYQYDRENGKSHK